MRNLEPITRADTVELENVLWNELGTKREYNKFTSNTLAGGNVAAFIRSIVGLDKQAAEKRFSQFLSDNQLNSQQQEYLKTIINYVNENGDITTDVLINESPFDSYDWQEVFGDNVAFISKYVNTLHSVIVAR
ncbi:type I restriction-modification enzyme R subunit C-terminal domain-containing protein [Snodgrassella sp. M0351]|uniref:type I restriction-modification enzyme R subunit C-terminal domain-containing protein n=1 Tax=unclassified Snodgrassella TaxID=2625236 RepID=UPI00351C7998